MSTDDQTLSPVALLAQVVAGMPDPTSREQATLLEAELAATHGVAHAVTVSSGTAALHTALAACGIGPGDEVLLPSTTVIMTVAAVVQAGARPVFVDASPNGGLLDLADAAAKITARTRAIVPVHLAGRCGDLDALTNLASRAGLDVIEDACQAHGSRYRGRLLGTVGMVGCFSLKDGKLVSCGEGGYLVTNYPDLATRAAAFRTHWQTPAPGQPALSRLGTNYRLAEPLAALARCSLARLDDTLSRRQRAAARLEELVSDLPGVAHMPPTADEQPNGYCALWRILLPDPRGLCRRLADVGVLNSVGTFGLRAAHLHPACQQLHPAPCPRAERAVDTLLAVPTPEDDERIDEIAALIRKEVRAW